DLWSLACDHNLFLHATDFQSEIHAESRPNRHRDTAAYLFLETRKRSRYFIRSRRNIRDNKPSGLIRKGCPFRSGLEVFRGHRYTRDHRPLGIMNRTHDSSRNGLSNRSWRVEKQKENSHEYSQPKVRFLHIAHWYPPLHHSQCCRNRDETARMVIRILMRAHAGDRPYSLGGSSNNGMWSA